MSFNNTDEKYAILKRFFKGMATHEEKQIVNDWMNDPEQEVWIKALLNQLWDDMDEINKMPDSQKTLTDIHEKIDIEKSVRPVFYRILKIAGSVAAILLLPLLAYISWSLLINEKDFTEYSQVEPVYNEITCPVSARCQFELPDGSKIWLNNGSRLKYPVTFDKKVRIVSLEGEAYFDIESNKDYPFIIKTNGIDVRVTGTRLNVCAYPTENYQEVVVESGTVELINKITDPVNEESMVELKTGQYALFKEKNCEIDFNTYIQNGEGKLKIIKNEDQLKPFIRDLRPYERALYEDNGSILLIKNDKAKRYYAWKEGRLVLRNDPMAVMLNRIERWYNVSFQIEDKDVYNHSYWATFENENIEEILELLSMTGPLRFEVKDRKINEDGSFGKKIINVSLNKTP